MYINTGDDNIILITSLATGLDVLSRDSSSGFVDVATDVSDERGRLITLNVKPKLNAMAGYQLIKRKL